MEEKSDHKKNVPPTAEKPDPRKVELETTRIKGAKPGEEERETVEAEEVKPPPRSRRRAT